LGSARDVVLTGGDCGEGVVTLILRQLWHYRTLTRGSAPVRLWLSAVDSAGGGVDVWATLGGALVSKACSCARW
jgi:hypothetical protein